MCLRGSRKDWIHLVSNLNFLKENNIILVIFMYFFYKVYFIVQMLFFKFFTNVFYDYCASKVRYLKDAEQLPISGVIAVPHFGSWLHFIMGLIIYNKSREIDTIIFIGSTDGNSFLESMKNEIYKLGGEVLEVDKLSNVEYINTVRRVKRGACLVVPFDALHVNTPHEYFNFNGYAFKCSMGAARISIASKASFNLINPDYNFFFPRFRVITLATDTSNEMLQTQILVTKFLDFVSLNPYHWWNLPRLDMLLRTDFCVTEKEYLASLIKKYETIIEQGNSYVDSHFTS